MVPSSDINKEILQEKILLQSLTEEQEQQINTLNLKNSKLSTLNHEINELKQEKFLREETESFHASHNRKKIVIVCVAALMSAGLLFYGLTIVNNSTESGLTSGYLIQNLKGDTIDTWLSWQIPPEKTLYVGIVQNQHLTNERLDIIKSVIMSDDTVEIDDNLLHKGPPGSTSTYFIGWSGALQSITHPTQHVIPSRFEIISDTNPVGDIMILLTDMTSGDGYAGFTKSIADDSQNQILKSTITIYDIEKISNQELETLVRHEMGHALGLAHSTAPEDLMHPVILTDYPYISECDLDAIFGLYDGMKKSEVICES